MKFREIIEPLILPTLIQIEPIKYVSLYSKMHSISQDSHVEPTNFPGLIMKAGNIRQFGSFNQRTHLET